MAALAAAIDGLGTVELHDELTRPLLDATVALTAQVERARAQLARVVAHVDRMDLCSIDGAVSTASWLRARTNGDPATVSTLVRTGRRLRDLPQLERAFREGAITYDHVRQVCRAATPSRLAAVQQVEDTLVELAQATSPRSLAVALRSVRDVVDPDGSEPDAAAGSDPDRPPGPDPRREVTLSPTIDGLWDLRGILDPVAGEALATALESLMTFDGPEVPSDQRRTPAQRRADALGDLALRALDGGDLPTVQRVRPHLLITVDLLRLLERTGDGEPTSDAGPVHDDASARAAAAAAADLTPASTGMRMSFSGEVDPDVILRAARDARVTAVAMMGPWRAAGVGRTQRDLPGWLRCVLEIINRRCRGPDCDRPAVWTDAHHVEAWTDGGPTDLENMLPLCRAHHQMVTDKRWHATAAHDDGTVTWTSSAGRTVHVPPEPW